jgi:DeoR/GlpR family transcriptional regulator of sugar metabolism
MQKNAARYSRAIEITARHKRLIALIEAGQFSSSDLAKKLGVSEQTIYRDIDFLKKHKYPIRSEKHAYGWAYHLYKMSTPAARRGETALK